MRMTKQLEPAARVEKAGTVQVEPIQIQAIEIKPLFVDGDEVGADKER